MNDVTGAVLAGGLGTRLRSVVADRPQVLAPVGARPFLAYLLDQLATAGVRETVLLVGYGADQVRAAIGKSHLGMSITYSQEPAPLGTGGAIAHALPLLRTETVLLLNGDSYCDVDLSELVRGHRQRSSVATLTLSHVENAARYGRITVNGTDRIERFAEKDNSPAPGWINAGVYAINRNLLDAIPADGPVSLERDLLPTWVTNGAAFGYRCRGEFLDIGLPESYAEATAFLARVMNAQSCTSNGISQSTIASPMRAGNRL